MSETCFNCFYNNGSMCMSTNGCHFEPKSCDNCSDNPDNYPSSDKEYLDKLIDDHWGYIESVLLSALPYGDVTENDVSRIAEIEFHYKSSGKHFWKHACEYYGVGDANT